MTKQQNNKQTMYKAVLRLIETNSAKTSSHPGIAESVGRFQDLMEAIQNNAVLVKQARAGKAAAKEESRAELTAAVLQMSAALHAVSVQRSDEELKAKVSNRGYRLAQLRDAELASTAASVLQVAQQNSGEIASRGVTSEVLVAYEGKISEFKTAIGESQSSFAVRKSCRKAIKDLMSEVDSVLKDELDRYFQFFRFNDPGLFDAYFAARMIKDVGLRHPGGQIEVVAPVQPDIIKAA